MAVPTKAASDRGVVKHPLVAELLNQTDGGAEGAAPGVDNAEVLTAGAAGDFLTHDDDRFVASHLLADGLVDGLAYL